jgi:YppG-like protein
MFPERPRRPMPLLPTRSQRPPQKAQKSVSGFIGNFQDAEGNLDISKLTTTGKQIMDLYNQVSPLMTRFIKK